MIIIIMVVIILNDEKRQEKIETDTTTEPTIASRRITDGGRAPREREIERDSERHRERKEREKREPSKLQSYATQTRAIEQCRLQNTVQ